jgi:hypothetical protein
MAVRRIQRKYDFSVRIVSQCDTSAATYAMERISVEKPFDSRVAVRNLRIPNEGN